MCNTTINVSGCLNSICNALNLYVTFLHDCSWPASSRASRWRPAGFNLLSGRLQSSAAVQRAGGVERDEHFGCKSELRKIQMMQFCKNNNIVKTTARNCKNRMHVAKVLPQRMSTFMLAWWKSASTSTPHFLQRVRTLSYGEMIASWRLGLVGF